MRGAARVFSREKAGAQLTLHETQSRDAIKHARRTIAYVAIGADLWGQLLVERFNQHEELLAALRGLLEECERHGSFEHVGFHHPLVSPFFDAARAAIARAEGQS